MGGMERLRDVGARWLVVLASPLLFSCDVAEGEAWPGSIDFFYDIDASWVRDCDHCRTGGRRDGLFVHLLITVIRHSVRPLILDPSCEVAITIGEETIRGEVTIEEPRPPPGVEISVAAFDVQGVLAAPQKRTLTMQSETQGTLTFNPKTGPIAMPFTVQLRLF